MAIWLTADLHLGHLRICELAGRPFGSVEEMNETLIGNYNASVRPGDTVYILGDVCMGKLDENLPMAGRLNGRKILILGNHDRPSRLYPHRTEEKRAEWASRYATFFDEMHESLVLNEWLLCHLPYGDPTFVDHEYEGRFSEFQPRDEGHILIHGHVHEAWKQRRTSRGTQMVNVGVDVWDYAPASTNTVEQLLKES